MRIGIVNDQLLAREALRRVVASVPGYKVAWIAEDGEAAVASPASQRHGSILGCVIASSESEVEVGWENGRWAWYPAERANEVLVRTS